MLKLSRRHFSAGSAVAVLALMAPAAFAAEVADVIYAGGPIHTMDDANPLVEAVAVKAGRIIAAGDAAEVMKLKGETTQTVDLAGRTMLPGFVDPHGHVTMGGLQAVTANLLPPPDGPNGDIAQIQQTLKDWAAANADTVKQVKLIMGFGYDESQLKEQRPPNRQELDAVSSEYPVVIVHQSGHIAVFNSKALDLVGYSAATPNPEGGVIRREPGSEQPNGVLEEVAWLTTIPKVLGNIGPTGMQALARAGVDLWASYGYTTAQEGRAVPGLAEVLKAVAAEGGLKIDVVSYVDVLVDRDYILKNHSRDYVGRYRNGGAKLTIDGSPQGFTAWRDRPYYDPVGDYPPGYAGYAAATPKDVLDAVAWAYANNLQIITHSNGEAASDLLITAIREAQKAHGRLPTRPVLIHGQFQREDQADSFVELGVFPSLFPMHTFYWGDWHRDHTVGPANGDNISPTGWYVTRGAMFSTHTDAPVAFPDTMRVLSATVTRRTRSGDILGPMQRVPVETALKAMTIWPAYQHFEEADKGSIAVGKLADLVILTDDPTAIDPMMLDQIKVAETIKEGRTVYTAPPEKLKKADAGRGMGNPFSDFLVRLAAERDVRNMPEGRRTPLMRKLMAGAPHNGGCVSGVIADMTRAMLGQG
ncbi:amidohydrolase [Aestuariivirga litoralis]|uniref:Amidohydrolase n=1 Tax=Aestuariivirga litoralis TaxID=2650924 RepID=A0A2W2ARQ9_9HYPH|nr:amidohydrolase [Aestuariivirga litoralis]PZF76312.1 amidohydrolase [Aestuariivirga litoralis]